MRDTSTSHFQNGYKYELFFIGFETVITSVMFSKKITQL